MDDLDARHPLGTVLSVCPQLAVAVPVLASGTAPAVRTAWQAARDGHAVTALAATDAGAAGSDLTAMTTTACIGDHQVVLDGGKRWITAAAVADQALVLARHREGTHFTSFTWVLVPMDAPGVSLQEAGTALYPGAGLAHIAFDGVRVPRDHVVGRIGYGMASFARHIATERFLSGAWANALCRRAIADTRAVLDGGERWRNEAVRQRLAACHVDQRGLDALCRATEQDLTPSTAMVLKAAAGQTLERVLAYCAQLHGADGFADDGLQLLRAAAGMFGVAGGPTEMLLGLIADDLPVERRGQVAA
jgi:alkylation response protein AidB-like acyl-CoA dehydrogenase